MTIFGEEHFLDKTMLKISKQIDNEVFDNIHKASLKIGVEVDKDKLKHWLILCGQLENIDQSYLIDLATKRKFDEKDLHIAKLEEEQMQLASENDALKCEKDNLERSLEEAGDRITELEEEVHIAYMSTDKMKIRLGENMRFLKNLKEENAKLQEQLKNAIVPKFKLGQDVFVEDWDGQITKGKVYEIQSNADLNDRQP